MAPDDDAPETPEPAAEAADGDQADAPADEPAVVTTEVQPPTDEVEDVQPEPIPPAEMLHGVLVSRSRGQVVLHPSREEYLDLVRRLRDEGYWACLDVTGVDYLGYRAERELPPGVTPERFEVVAMLLNHTERSRLRLRVQVPEDDPTVPSLFPVHTGVMAPEREVYDMFGITFEGHPDMTRILMPDEWVGHPLRKDEHSGRIPVQFKGTASGH